MGSNCDSVYVTKPGKHGTLYRYAVEYSVAIGEAPLFFWNCWAYCPEHMLDQFYGRSIDGCTILRWAKHKNDTRTHKWTWHEFPRTLA